MKPQTLTFVIAGTLPALNLYVDACRTHAQVGARFKRDAEALIAPFLPKTGADLKYPVDLDVWWFEPSNRRDADNVHHAIKYILDALTRAGVLHGDGRRYVRDIAHHTRTDVANPRVEVTLTSHDSPLR